MSSVASNAPVAILLVDDDRRNLIALEAMLDGLGLIVSASTVDDALRHLLLHDFALILLDIRMPDMDGIELASVIRQRECSRRVPIIFLTAHDGGDELVARGYAVGAVDFLFKPPVPEILRSKVMVFVDLHRKNREVALQAEQLLIAEGKAHERRLAEFRASVEASALRSEMVASKRMNDRLQLLATAATELLARADPFEVVNTLAARFLEHLGYEVCVCYQARDDGGRARLISAAGADPSWNHPQIDIDDTPVMRAVFVERGRYVRDELDEEMPPWLRELGLTAVAAFPLLSVGKTVGMLACGRRGGALVTPEDLAAIGLICDQLALANEREHLMRSLREHADALSESHRRKDEFLAMLAHELRNPLAPMIYALEMLEHHEQASEAIELREVLGRQLTHLSRMVDDLLDVSRITSGKIDLTLAPVTIQHAMRQALETSRPQLDKYDHHVVLELPEQELVLNADATRLIQVIANLLNNAARYTDPGGHIVLHAHRDGNKVVVRVRDDGHGIPRHMLPKVFELFVRSAPAIARRVASVSGSRSCVVSSRCTEVPCRRTAKGSIAAASSRWCCRSPKPKSTARARTRRRRPGAIRRDAAPAGCRSSSSRTTRTAATCCRCCSSRAATPSRLQRTAPVVWRRCSPVVTTSRCSTSGFRASTATRSRGDFASRHRRPRRAWWRSPATARSRTARGHWAPASTTTSSSR